MTLGPSGTVKTGHHLYNIINHHTVHAMDITYYYCGSMRRAYDTYHEAIRLGGRLIEREAEASLQKATHYYLHCCVDLSKQSLSQFASKSPVVDIALLECKYQHSDV